MQLKAELAVYLPDLGAGSSVAGVTESAAPPFRLIHSPCPAENAESERHMAKHLRRGIVEPSSSP